MRLDWLALTGIKILLDLFFIDINAIHVNIMLIYCLNNDHISLVFSGFNQIINDEVNSSAAEKKSV